MAAPIRPNGVKTFGKEKYIFVPTVASVTAPTATEINSASGLDLTGFLYVDGFDGPSAEAGRVTAPRRVGDTESYEAIGTTSYTFSNLVYAFDPQAATGAVGKKAYEKLPEGTTGYIVQRLGIDRDTDVAAAQRVNLFPIQVGPQVIGRTGDDESAEVSVTQGVAITGKPTLDVAVV